MPHLVFPSEVIDEEDLPTNPCALDFMHLWSLMSYPQDEAAQDRLIQGVTAGHTKSVIADLQARFGKTHDVTVSADLALYLSDAPDARTVAEQSAIDAAFGGTIAGVILGWTIFNAQRLNSRGSASLGNAFKMIDEACKKGRWRGGGIENLKKHIWPTFRPVAHFWAALQIWHDKEYDLTHLAMPGGLSLFLQMAEWFRMQGERYIPLRGKASILNADETWKIRPEVSADWPRFDIRCDDLNAWDLRKRIKFK